METESITVEPLARVKRLRFTDLTRAGKAEEVSRHSGTVGRCDSVGGLPAPDTQNFLGAGNTGSCADEKSQCRVGCVGTRTANSLRDEIVSTCPTVPDSPNHLIADDEKSNRMEGNT